MRTTRSLVWVVVAVVGVITLVVSVVVVQRGHTEPDLPGRVGPATAPSGAATSGGAALSDKDVLYAWAKAASIGDYSTARLYMEPDETMITNWQDQHEYIVKSIKDYHISNIEVRGQTTLAVVRFQETTISRCLNVQVNNITKRLSVPYAYRDCRPGE